MGLLRQRIRQIEEALGMMAGNDPAQDRYRVGAVAAYRDMLNIEFEEVDG